ncbi:MAG: thiamine pyrophosphate-dependent enzyme [bacterium]
MKTEILGGNEILIQGGLEAGFSLYTGYPGSPLADYFNILHKRSKELEARGIRVAIANSEANAAAMASGAKQAGRDCLVGMKSMGLHVASDALSVGNFANPGPVFTDPKTGEKTRPGVVIAVGDDPWSISTSTPADSRYLFKHLHIPFLEPATPQELKDWMGKALELSRSSSVYTGLLLTTFMAEGGGRVEVGEPAQVAKAKSALDPATFDLQKNVMVPPNSLIADQTMLQERWPQVIETLKKLALDQCIGKLDSKIGILTSGLVHETIKHVIEDAGLLSEVSLYKSAGSFPLNESQLLPWLKGLEKLIVVEEKRGFLEAEVVSVLQKEKLSPNLFGKKFDGQDGFPAHGGLNYDIIATKLLPLLAKEAKHIPTCTLEQSLPRRLPTFCPGCPHRETLSVLKEIRAELDKEGLKLLTHGDVGCYSLSFLPPFKEMHNLSAMGQGGALGAGVDLFSTNPSVVLMGDSTFFHSGLTDISNSVQLDHDITYILLDNDNTAMTGHQMTPASGLSVEGKERPRQSMLQVARALGVKETLEIHPSDRYFYKNLLLNFVKRPGVKVIVSTKECALTFHGKQRAKERELFKSDVKKEQVFYNINTLACEDCRACVDATGCPGLTQTMDAYGTKISIDPQVCVADGYCTRIKACPSFEEVIVYDYHPTKYKSLKGPGELEVSAASESKISLADIAAGKELRIVVTGVGGSGVTTISRVLAAAAKNMGGREDIDFKYVDQKGLAQRNGNVTAHLTLFPKGRGATPVTPAARADVLLSPDLLDGAQHLSFLSPTGNVLLDASYQVPLSLILDDAVAAPLTDEAGIRTELQQKLGDRLELISFKELSQAILGKSVYASAMVLGAAFQKGLFPFSLEDLRDALSQAVKGGEGKTNLQAFEIGRAVVALGEKKVRNTLIETQDRPSEMQLLKFSLIESCAPWEDSKKLLKAWGQATASLKELFKDINEDHLAQYAHDLLIFDRGHKMNDFLELAKQISNRYEVTHQAQALRTLTKTFFIKDEVFVAHLMLSPQKRAHDEARFKKLGTSYRYKFINRPSFDIAGRKIEFDLSPKMWMLKSMRHLRFLRSLLSTWHGKEKLLAKQIQKCLMAIPAKYDGDQIRQELQKLENVKGYREVRYKKAEIYGVTP